MPPTSSCERFQFSVENAYDRQVTNPHNIGFFDDFLHSQHAAVMSLQSR